MIEVVLSGMIAFGMLIEMSNVTYQGHPGGRSTRCAFMMQRLGDLFVSSVDDTL